MHLSEKQYNFFPRHKINVLLLSSDSMFARRLRKRAYRSNVIVNIWSDINLPGYNLINKNDVILFDCDSNLMSKNVINSISKFRPVMMVSSKNHFEHVQDDLLLMLKSESPRKITESIIDLANNYDWKGKYFHRNNYSDNNLSYVG